MSETKVSPARELALQLAASHRLERDTADSIVARAEKYAEFLQGGESA